MTVASYAIDPARFLEDHLAQASPELLREMLGTFINQLLTADADQVCGASSGTISEDRVNRRNGYRTRGLDARASTLDVKIPKLHQGTYFPDWLLERRRRAKAALTTVVATSYLLGANTRRMDDLVQALGITGLSTSQVSEMAKDLDEQVAVFRTRPLDQGPYSFVAADALTMTVREGGGGVKVAAIGATVGGAWQRCRTHYAANLMSTTPKGSWPWVKTLLGTVSDQPDAESVHAQFDRVLDALEHKLPRSFEHLEAAREESLAFASFPKSIWRQLWSNNPNERLNREIRRRTDIDGIFPNRDAIIRLVGAVLAEQHDRWAEQRRSLGLDALATARHVGEPNIEEAIEPDLRTLTT